MTRFFSSSAATGIVLVTVGTLCAGAARAQQLSVPAELWDRPRTGQLVIAAAPIRSALSALLADREAKLTIRHGPEAEASAQAEELRAWLVAHAVEPARVVLRADLPARQPLQLEVGAQK